jgi:hypothetical protein
MIPFKCGDTGGVCYICQDAVVSVRPCTELYAPPTATATPMATICTLDGKETRVQGTVHEIMTAIVGGTGAAFG